MRTTAVIPVYNNADVLPELIQRLRRIPDLKILFVEDRGSDDCSTLLERDSDEVLGALMLAQNVGQHRAIFAGLREVQTEQAIVLDGDLQDRPEAIPGLLNGLAEADIVFAQREGPQGWGSYLFKSLFRLLSRGRLPHNVGTFVALGPRALTRMQAVNNPNPYLVGLLALSGLTIHSVPVGLRQDSAKSSYDLGKRLSLALRAVRGSGLLSWLPQFRRPQEVIVEKRTGWTQ